jgi:hypothetical protein
VERDVVGAGHEAAGPALAALVRGGREGRGEAEQLLADRVDVDAAGQVIDRAAIERLDQR